MSVFSGIGCAVTALLVLAFVPHSLGVGTATFENYSEGDTFAGSFTDPLSGISFSDATGSAPGFFTIEFIGPEPQLPNTSPGNILGSAGYVPGPGFGLTFEFGFRSTLPKLADEVSMDIVYATDPGALLVLDAFDMAGALVASTALSPPPGLFLETGISVTSPHVNIHSFRITATNIFAGYDNIAFVPEPVSAGAALMIALVGLRRWKRSA